MSEKILGIDIEKWCELIESPCASKALDYYDGEQHEAMEELLDDPHKGRKKWRERGIIPRFRNITYAIVEKSGKLFKDTAPKIEVFNHMDNSVNEQATDTLLQELEKTEYLEFFNNLDSITRLLKTTLVLVQYDATGKELYFELLHQANSAVLMDQSMKNIVALIYQTSDADDNETYRIITQDEYIDLIESENELTGVETVSIANRMKNPYGFVPVACFHDTRKPRNGFWNKPGMDLVNINEVYNLHLTDSEYAISWSKLPTLFTNCNFQDTEDQLTLAVEYGQKLPHFVRSETELLGGPSRVVQLDSNGIDSPFVEYKTPSVDIKPLDEVVTNWLEQFAHDWSVKLSTNSGGQGRASSGFQLVVEELPNRELRQQRSKMFTAGFKRLYSIIAQVLNVQYGREYLPVDADAYVEFPIKELPTDSKQNEETWDIRIKSGRASLIDYLIEEKGMTKDEAILKAEEINIYNQQFNNNTNMINKVN